jgi:lysophospholipase L1-like esterase
VSFMRFFPTSLRLCPNGIKQLFLLVYTIPVFSMASPVRNHVAQQDTLKSKVGEHISAEYCAQNTVLPTDSVISWSGRWSSTQEGQGAVVVDWPAVRAQTILQQGALYAQIQGRSTWEVFINRKWQAFIQVEDSACVHLATVNHSAPAHVEFIKSSENQTNQVTVTRFAFSSNAQLKPVRPMQRRIEFIGDSYTVGFGNGSEHTHPPSGMEDSLVFYSTRAALSYGAIIARNMGGDFQINAMSGRGLVHNYNGIIPEKTLLYHYQKSLVSADYYSGPAIALDWDFTKWHPQVIVISIGINDFQQNNSDKPVEVFVQEYRKFLGFLRSKHPRVQFILCATYVWPKDVLKQAVQTVVQQEKQAGHTDVVYFEFTAQKSGLYSHPNLQDHEAIAQQLQSIITRRGGWLSR